MGRKLYHFTTDRRLQWIERDMSLVAGEAVTTIDAEVNAGIGQSRGATYISLTAVGDFTRGYPACKNERIKLKDKAEWGGTSGAEILYVLELDEDVIKEAYPNARLVPVDYYSYMTEDYVRRNFNSSGLIKFFKHVGAVKGTSKENATIDRSKMEKYDEKEVRLYGVPELSLEKVKVSTVRGIDGHISNLHKGITIQASEESDSVLGNAADLIAISTFPEYYMELDTDKAVDQSTLQKQQQLSSNAVQINQQLSDVKQELQDIQNQCKKQIVNRKEKIRVELQKLVTSRVRGISPSRFELDGTGNVNFGYFIGEFKRLNLNTSDLEELQATYSRQLQAVENRKNAATSKLREKVSSLETMLDKSQREVEKLQGSELDTGVVDSKIRGGFSDYLSESNLNTLIQKVHMNLYKLYKMVTSSEDIKSDLTDYLEGTKRSVSFLLGQSSGVKSARFLQHLLRWVKKESGTQEDVRSADWYREQRNELTDLVLNESKVQEYSIVELLLR